MTLPTLHGQHTRILVAVLILKPGAGFHTTHRQDSGPGSYSAPRATGETYRWLNDISKRKEDPGVPCPFGSMEKSKPSFKQRKQKAMADSERHHITFLAFRGCLRSLCNSKLLYFSKTLASGTLDSKNLRYF